MWKPGAAGGCNEGSLPWNTKNKKMTTKYIENHPVKYILQEEKHHNAVKKR